MVNCARCNKEIQHGDEREIEIVELINANGNYDSRKIETKIICDDCVQDLNVTVLEGVTDG